MKKVLFISSTGGHFDELMQLEPIFKNYDYSIITEKDNTTKNLNEKFGKKIKYLLYGTRKKKLQYPFVFIINTFISLFLFFKIKPQYIITTGTHTAVPLCYIAKVFRKKIIYIETFANRNTKTLAGRIIYPIANLFIVQWEDMLKLYPKAILGGSIY